MRAPVPPFRTIPVTCRRDQGFLNSFYPYFAACPAFEPYPIVGSRLAGVGSGFDDSGGILWGRGEGSEDKRMPAGGDGKRDSGEWVRPQGWGCKRLPTRYNGDWPLLFVDGDLQVTWEGGGGRGGGYRPVWVIKLFLIRTCMTLASS